MSSIKEALLAAVGAILFVAAVSLVLFYVKVINSEYDAAIETGGDSTSLVYESVSDAEVTITKTYKDVISELLTDSLPYDVEIDGVLIKAEDYNLAHLQDYDFPEHAQYDRGYVYDAEGNLVLIRYRSR